MILLAESKKGDERIPEPSSPGRPAPEQLHKVYEVLKETVRTQSKVHPEKYSKLMQTVLYQDLYTEYHKNQNSLNLPPLNLEDKWPRPLYIWANVGHRKRQYLMLIRTV
jgi:hypothetical protein